MSKSKVGITTAHAGAVFSNLSTTALALLRIISIFDLFE